MRRTALVLLVVAACAPSAAQRVSEPIAPARDWVSPLYRDHPLVGRIWSVREGRFVDEPALDAVAATARVLLLGETHDNVDHHLLQARMVRSVVRSGGRPAVAFEMLTPEQQPAIDAALAQPKPSADAIGKAVAWDQSGWPPFKAYRPIFVEAVAAGLPILGANLPRKQVRDIVMKGKDAIPPPVAARIDRKGPPTPEEEDALKKEMEAAHCGELPAAHMAPMLVAQRSRDAQMADAVVAASKRGEAVALVTGAEHARRDRGVASYLFGDAGDAVVSIAFREVHPDATTPDAYAADEGVAKLPYDYVVFTPAAEREDPCLELHKRSQTRREQAAPPAGQQAAPGGQPAPPAGEHAAPPAGQPAAPAQPSPPPPPPPPQKPAEEPSSNKHAPLWW